MSFSFKKIIAFLVCCFVLFCSSVSVLASTSSAVDQFIQENPNYKIVMTKRYKTVNNIYKDAFILVDLDNSFSGRYYTGLVETGYAVRPQICFNNTAGVNGVKLFVVDSVTDAINLENSGNYITQSFTSNGVYYYKISGTMTKYHYLTSSEDDTYGTPEQLCSSAYAFFLTPPQETGGNQQVMTVLIQILAPFLKWAVYLVILLIAFLLFVTLLGTFFKKFLM